MATQAPLNMSAVLADYIQLRRNGRSMDDAVNELRDAAFQLSRDERKQLGQVVNEWEARYGAQPRSAPPMLKPDAVAPQPVVPQKQMSPAPFGTTFLDPSKLPPAPVRSGDQTVACLRCGKALPRGTTVCQFCNQTMPPLSIVTRQLQSLELVNGKAPLVSPTFFGPNSTLVMLILGQKKPIEAFPRSQLVIGRASPLNPKPVNIDLTTFNAEALGVSRNHAQLRCQDNMLLLVDLKSPNGTFVNELRIYPNEARALRSGDEIRLGKMTIKITFKH